jgi:iron-sulfur cluster repair protein YtfE (RIC family)
MTDITAPRLDIYAPIHRALRLFMTDTLGRLGALDVDDARERAEVLDQLASLLELCTKHLLAENQHVHPALEAIEPGATRDVGEEHARHQLAIAALQAESTALRVAPDAALALRLYRRLALFVAENFEHMHIEETTHNPLLWAGYDDAAIAAIEQRIVAHASPQQRTLVLRWMTPALPPAERLRWFRALQRNLPADAFAAMLAAARAALDERAWTRLSAALRMPQPA